MSSRDTVLRIHCGVWRDLTKCDHASYKPHGGIKVQINARPNGTDLRSQLLGTLSGKITSSKFG